jgi:hypothetical protein
MDLFIYFFVKGSAKRRTIETHEGTAAFSHTKTKSIYVQKKYDTFVYKLQTRITLRRSLRLGIYIRKRI